MQVKQIIADVGVGLIGGYVGTKVMEPVSMKLYELEPEADRQQEDRVRPGPPYEIAARKTAALLGLQLTDKQVEQAGLVFHYGLGMSWGTVYTLLRRLTPLPKALAGLLTGASLSLLIDEGLTPLLGFSAPNRAYPLSTHVRGFVAHLVYGLSVADVAESLAFLGRTSSLNAR
jgi:uncharacterized membrane protein YagU involved in acid resistance